jgi:hypothetical protein
MPRRPSLTIYSSSPLKMGFVMDDWRDETEFNPDFESWRIYWSE